MSLIRWNPNRNLLTLPKDLDQFFSDFGLDFRNTDTVWNPHVDIKETDEYYEVKAEIPGMSKKDINIKFRDDVLAITGERKNEQETKNDRYHRMERSYGKFERHFHFPTGVKANDIKANYKNGVLIISIPKTEEVKPKEIAIS